MGVVGWLWLLREKARRWSVLATAAAVEAFWAGCGRRQRKLSTKNKNSLRKKCGSAETVLVPDLALLGLGRVAQWFRNPFFSTINFSF
jgi:hypothetical protein